MENNLNRFIDAQSYVYEQVVKELKQGRKTSHWMWYIFPQIQGLGHSTTAQFYAIHSLSEAKEYLNHPVLGSRLIECCRILLGITGKTAKEILGGIDAVKLRSSMTLFSLVSEDDIFSKVLDLYYEGKKDRATLEIAESISE